MANCESKPGRECTNKDMHPFIETLLLEADPKDKLPEGKHPCLHDLLNVPSIKRSVDVDLVIKGCSGYIPQQRKREIIYSVLSTK